MQTDRTGPTGGVGGPSRGARRYTRPLKVHSSRSEVSDSDEERQKCVQQLDVRVILPDEVRTGA